MYDMYPWDQTAPRPAEDASAPAAQAIAPVTQAIALAIPAIAPATSVTPAVQAVQFALDRRDNGGDPAPAPALRSSAATRQ